jgi:hypothetical protein
MVVTQKFETQSTNVGFLLDIPVEAGPHFFRAAIRDGETLNRCFVLEMPGSLKENGEKIRSDIFEPLEEDADRTLKMLFVEHVGWIYHSYDWHNDHPIPLEWTWYRIVSEDAVEKMIEDKLKPLRDMLEEISVRPGMPEYHSAQERFEKVREDLLTSATVNLPKQST